MEVLVHPQLGLLCGAALPGAFFLQKNTPLEKKHDFACSFKDNGRPRLVP